MGPTHEDLHVVIAPPLPHPHFEKSQFSKSCRPPGIISELRTRILLRRFLIRYAFCTRALLYVQSGSGGY